MIYKFKQLQQLIVASIHEKWKRENRQNRNQEKSKKGRKEKALTEGLQLRT
jgi:hypothetical protein